MLGHPRSLPCRYSLTSFPAIGSHLCTPSGPCRSPSAYPLHADALHAAPHDVLSCLLTRPACSAQNTCRDADYVILMQELGVTPRLPHAGDKAWSRPPITMDFQVRGAVRRIARPKTSTGVSGARRGGFLCAGADVRRVWIARAILEGLREEQLPDHQMGALHHKGGAVPAQDLSRQGALSVARWVRAGTFRLAGGAGHAFAPSPPTYVRVGRRLRVADLRWV